MSSEMLPPGLRDPAKPYGTPLRAILFVKGWQTRYILILLILSLCASAAAVAMATAIGHSFEVGLAVGSYVLGIAAMLAGTLTTICALLP